MALSDLEILARLIQCEAGGEGENGMQAVASVIMNRVHITYGEYGQIQHHSRSGISAKDNCMCYGNGKRFLQYAKSI